jgi:hypothetical protein
MALFGTYVSLVTTEKTNKILSSYELLFSGFGQNTILAPSLLFFMRL